jgi:hypothetical protein
MRLHAKPCRDVAQPGRALAWGARGRQFKSARPDQLFVSSLPSTVSQNFCRRPRAPQTNAQPQSGCAVMSARGADSQSQRDRQFESARPDQLFVSVCRRPFPETTSADREHPKTIAQPQSGCAVMSARGADSRSQRDRQFKSARPDQ